MEYMHELTKFYSTTWSISNNLHCDCDIFANSLIFFRICHFQQKVSEWFEWLSTGKVELFLKINSSYQNGRNRNLWGLDLVIISEAHVFHFSGSFSNLFINFVYFPVFHVIIYPDPRKIQPQRGSIEKVKIFGNA